MLSRFQEKRDREALVNETAQEVMKMISFSADADEAAEEISALRREVQELFDLLNGGNR